MSVPVIPKKCREEVINDILESIALEETAMAHVINAEGEKIQKVVACHLPEPKTFSEVLAFQASVSTLFDKLIQKQNILLEKMKILQNFKECDDEKPCHNEKLGHNECDTEPQNHRNQND